MRQLSDALAPLMAQPRWVFWLREDNRKVPYQPRAPYIRASTTNPAHWSTLAKAIAAADQRKGHLGFCLLGSGIGAFDLDDCIDDDGCIALWALKVLSLAPGAYVESTPSHKGLRLVGLATGARVHRKLDRGEGSLEVWRDCERFMAVSGVEWGKCRRLPNIDAAIDSFALDGELSTLADIGQLHPARYEAREVLKKYRYRIVSLRDSVAVGWRSDVIWKVGVGLRERGATPSEIACVFLAMTAYVDKHGTNQQTLRREVERVFAKSSVKEGLRRT